MKTSAAVRQKCTSGYYFAFPLRHFFNPKHNIAMDIISMKSYRRGSTKYLINSLCIFIMNRKASPLFADKNFSCVAKHRFLQTAFLYCERF